jgi:hypothetical protein
MIPSLRRSAPLCALLIFGSLVGETRAQQPDDLRYAKNLAQELVSAETLKKVARIPEAVNASPPAPLIEALAVPFQDLPLPKTRKPRLSPLITSWDVPPFPDLSPPADGSISLKAPKHAASGPGNSHVAKPSSIPGAPMPGLEPYHTYQPSLRLRPRQVVLSGSTGTVETEIPPPFSSARYSTPKKGIFQLTLYGGTTSFDAENAYQALRNAVLQREPLEGVGTEAFLGHLAPETPAAPKVPDYFAALPPVGSARPDLLDPGLAAAHSAPAFQDIPVALKPTARPKYSVGGPALAPASKVYVPQYLTLVAYLPQQAVTLELVSDERLATAQDLVELAIKIQGRLIQQ